MADFPSSLVGVPGKSLGIISTLDFWGATPVLAVSDATNYPTASLAMYGPICVSTPFDVDKFVIVNGTVVSGNVDVGIYNRVGAKLWSSGAVTQTPASDAQTFDLSPNILLVPDMYYLAVSLSAVAGRLMKTTLGNVTQKRVLGWLEQASAHPLPETATFATAGQVQTPVLAIVSPGFTV